MQQTIEYIIDNECLCAWVEDNYYIDSEDDLTVEQIEDLLREENDEVLLDYCESEEDEEERGNSHIQWRFAGETEWRIVP